MSRKPLLKRLLSITFALAITFMTNAAIGYAARSGASSTIPTNTPKPERSGASSTIPTNTPPPELN